MCTLSEFPFVCLQYINIKFNPGKWVKIKTNNNNLLTVISFTRKLFMFFFRAGICLFSFRNFSMRNENVYVQCHNNNSTTMVIFLIKIKLIRCWTISHTHRVEDSTMFVVFNRKVSIMRHKFINYPELQFFSLLLLKLLFHHILNKTYVTVYSKTMLPSWF